MSRHQTERISGLLDGELKGLRRWAAERHVRACPVCAVEYRRQRTVRRMLHNNPTTARMSDSPEFFWSKVKSEIRNRSEESDAPSTGWVVHWLATHSMLATTTAVAIAIVCILCLRTSSRPSAPSTRMQASFARVERLKTAIPNTAATSLQPDDSQVTVIWVSGLPWAPNMNEMKTEFANLDT